MHKNIRQPSASAGADGPLEVETRSQAAGLESLVRAAPGDRAADDSPEDGDEYDQEPPQPEVRQEEGEGSPALMPGAPEAEGSAQTEIEALRMELQRVRSEGAKNRDLLMRSIAEAQNARRRAEEEVQRERKFGLERFVKALIPVVDSLDMALSMTDRRNPAVKSTLEGVESTLNLFLKELAAFGVERLDPVGQPFDPNFHQAISMSPSADTRPNHIMHVMQKGFLLNGRVVRPAMVVVSKGQEGPAEGAESANIDVKA